MSEGKQNILYIKKSANMAVNTAGAEVEYRITPAATERVQLTRLLFEIEDIGTFAPATWGAGLALTNGIKFRVHQDGVTYDLMDYVIKTTGGLSGLCFDVNYMDFGNAATSNILTSRFTFTKLGGNIRLNGENGDWFAAVTQDDFTGLEAQYITVEGFIENEVY